MENGTVKLNELREEIGAMLAVCFEGEVLKDGGRLALKLGNGQQFEIKVEEL